MTSKLYIGNNQATPSIVVEKPVPMPYSIVYKLDSNGKIVKDNSIPFDFTGIKDIADGTFQYTFQGDTNITQVDMSSLENITGVNACSYMFGNCTNLTSIDLSNLKNVGTDVYKPICDYMFYNCTGLTGNIDLSSLQGIISYSACQYMFSGCTSITSVDLSNLKTIDQYSASGMFSGCTKIISVNLSKLTGFTSQGSCQWMFQSCSSLKNISLPWLTTITSRACCQGMFSYCTSLESANLDSVVAITGNNACQGMFSGCTSLTELSFPSLFILGSYKTQFYGMLQGVTGCIVHFPSNLQSTMSSWSDVINGFGGTNTTILFDLPATDGNLDFSYLTEYGNKYISDYRGSPFYSTFQSNLDIISIDLSNLKYLYSDLFLNTCSNLQSIDLSSLEEINGALILNHDTSLTGLNLSNLKSIKGNINLQDCTSLETLDLSSLEIINKSIAYICRNCTSLTSVNLNNLTTISYSNPPLEFTFSNCTSLTELRFPSLKTVSSSSVFSNMLYGTSGVTVHFPSNLASYNFNCGGNNTTILYDLPPTE